MYKIKVIPFQVSSYPPCRAPINTSNQLWYFSQLCVIYKMAGEKLCVIELAYLLFFAWNMTEYPHSNSLIATVLLMILKETTYKNIFLHLLNVKHVNTILYTSTEVIRAKYYRKISSVYQFCCGVRSETSIATALATALATILSLTSWQMCHPSHIYISGMHGRIYTIQSLICSEWYAQ